MKKVAKITIGLAAMTLFLIFFLQGAMAREKAPESMMLKLEGAKMAPVSFSHRTHTEKAKAECISCHHKDKDPKRPGGCVPCHDIREVKKGAPPAKDAYHKNCINCHKEASAKRANAPVKCNDCHKKK